MTTPEHIWINATPNVVCGSFDTELFEGSVEYIRADLYDNTTLKAAAEMLADEHGWVRREKLDKAVEALQNISRNANHILSRFARNTLAELEGERMSESFARETLNQIKEKLGMSEEQQGPEQFTHDTERKLRDRIEQLERERDELRSSMGKAFRFADDTEAKLAKAVEALRHTLDKPRDADQSYAELCFEVMWEIRAVLAEITSEGNP